MDKPTAPATHVVSSYKYPSIDTLNLTSKRVWGDAGCPTNANWYVQEKIDGSQLTVIANTDYTFIDSKSQPLLFYNKGGLVSYTNKIFLPAMGMLSDLARSAEAKHAFNPDLAYHGEAVCTRRHNVIKYDRTPRFYFIMYDITKADGTYLSPAEMRSEAVRIGLETVPMLTPVNMDPKVSPYQTCQELINGIVAGTIKSSLGGVPEGVVLKHHAFLSDKGKTVATKLKYVTPAFREAHEIKNKREQATPDSAVQNVGAAYSLPARYHKAVQHMRDAGKLKYGEIDLVKLKEELDDDLERECNHEVMAYLWAELAPHVKRASRTSFDEWYKGYLAALNTEMMLSGAKSDS